MGCALPGNWCVTETMIVETAVTRRTAAVSLVFFSHTMFFSFENFFNMNIFEVNFCKYILLSSFTQLSTCDTTPQIPTQFSSDF